MATEILHIKNMVCPRCIASVQNILQNIPIAVTEITLGEVTLNEPVTKDQIILLKKQLLDSGFELLEDKKDKIVEAVKTNIIQLIKNTDFIQSEKLSSYLSKEIGYDYSHISTLFTASQGITVEKYLILQKIEYVKELLSYNELTLSEISDMLHYSSLSALSAQFKHATGMTPTKFKESHNQVRKSLDDLIP